MAGCGRRDFRLQGFNRDCGVLALETIENFRQQFSASGAPTPAGASALGAAGFPAQFPADEICTGATPAPNTTPDVNGIRCSPGRIGAPVRSYPPSEPTPEPTPISSIGGIMARGTPDSTGAGPIPPESAPLQNVPFPVPPVIRA